MQDEMTIRSMAPQEIGLALEWAAAEGWNPGLEDAGCFAAVDPEGFLIGKVAGRPAAIVSCVNYDAHFAFLGFYIVRPDLRGSGYGLRIWNAALAHAGARVVGLDGVVDQQENYRRSGFALAHASMRHGGTVERPRSGDGRGTVPLASVPFEAILASDSAIFPAPRPDFLKRWIHTPGHRGRALLRDGRLAAWGVMRPARSGHKIGPLVAEDSESAKAVLLDLLDTDLTGEVFLDVPIPNAAAVDLARSLALSPVFETARMYKGPAPALRLDRLYGITTFELG